MIKNLIGGIAVGLANIIPGVSGGTMMVVLGLFNKVMDSIDGLFKKNNPNRSKNFWFLVQIAVGALIGLVVFANVIKWLLDVIPTQLMFAFVGMVAFSIPSIVKKEMKHDKFKLLPFAIGCAIIIGLEIISPKESMKTVAFPGISLGYLIRVMVDGMIAGGAMFVPGVSGSMLLLLIGEYYLFTSLIAAVTTFKINVIIPLFFIGIGVILGVIISSKICNYMLKNHHASMMNFILGLVVSSAVVLIPFTGLTSLGVIVGSIVAFAVGGLLVILMDKLA